MRLGTCQVCKVKIKVVEFGRIASHAHPAPYGDMLAGNANAQCNGTGRVPQEVCDKNRATSRGKRRALVESARVEAAVVLDAVLQANVDVDALFPGRVEALIRIALTEYRLVHEQQHVYYPWRFVQRRAGDSNWRRRTGDLYCTFCGELIAGGVAATLIPTLRAFLKLTRAKVIALEKGSTGLTRTVRAHFEPCALSCLAGMTKMAKPGTRALPKEFQPENHLYQDDPP